MDYLESKIDFHEITPEQAQRWLSVCNFDNQRNTRSWWVDYLAKEIEADRFEAVATITFATDAETQIYYNINGKHTLHAIVQANKSVILPVSSFVVENEMRVKELFSRIDKNLKRTAKDSINILGIDEELEISKSETAILLTAVTKISMNLTHGGNRFKHTESEKLIVLKDFIKEFKLFRESVETDNKKYYKHGMIVAIALLLFRFQVEKAAEFWQLVSEGNGVKNSPTRELYDYIHYNINKKHTDSEIRNTIGYCWNQFNTNNNAYLTQNKITSHFENGYYLEGIDIDFQSANWNATGFFDFNSGS